MEDPRDGAVWVACADGLVRVCRDRLLGQSGGQVDNTKKAGEVTRTMPTALVQCKARAASSSWVSNLVAVAALDAHAWKGERPASGQESKGGEETSLVAVAAQSGTGGLWRLRLPPPPRGAEERWEVARVLLAGMLLEPDPRDCNSEAGPWEMASLSRAEQSGGCWFAALPRDGERCSSLMRKIIQEAEL